MTPQQFLSAVQQVIERAPEAELVKNRVGNLSIINADQDYIGWVDLRYGEVTFFEDSDDYSADAAFRARANWPTDQITGEPL